MRLKLPDNMETEVLRMMGADVLRRLFEEAEAANDDLTCFAVQDEFTRRGLQVIDTANNRLSS